MTQRLHHSIHVSALDAVVEVVESVLAWVCAPFRRGLETALRFGVRPTAATELEVYRWQHPPVETGPAASEWAAEAEAGKPAGGPD
ncbi:hypothetical protein [Allosphingosinicella humi]